MYSASPLQTPNHTPIYIQQRLTSLGVRIRKSVRDGYKVGKKRGVDSNGDSYDLPLDASSDTQESQPVQKSIQDFFR
jgi:hypothetical protein